MRQKRMERVWKSKNSMVIGYRQEIFDSGPDPLLLGNTLAFGAVPVSAGVKIGLRVSAVVASVDMITEL